MSVRLRYRHNKIPGIVIYTEAVWPSDMKSNHYQYITEFLFNPHDPPQGDESITYKVDFYSLVCFAPLRGR